MELQLKEEKARLEGAVDNGQAWHQGGINLDPSMVNMQVNKDEKGGFLPLQEQSVYNVNINGLVPVILKIAPALSVVDRVSLK
jgi:hypothetical protein